MIQLDANTIFWDALSMKDLKSFDSMFEPDSESLCGEGAVLD